MAEPWESKERFFERLGLNEKRRSHRRIFRQMLREAVVGRTIVLHSMVTSLDSTGTPEDMIVPHQVLCDAMRSTYDAASSQSKAICDLVTDQNGYCWILRWTLRWALCTHCETCLHGSRTSVCSSVTTPRGTEPDRIDSASPLDLTLSPRKRKVSNDGFQHNSTVPVNRQTVEHDIPPSPSTRSASQTSPVSPLSRKQSQSRPNVSEPSHMSAQHVDPGLGKTTSPGSPDSSPRTPLSLSSLLNPEPCA